MSFRLYLTRLKCLIRNKETIFWSYLFPIVLSTCFFFGFDKLGSIDSFETIKIAYVTVEAEPEGFRETMEQTMMNEDTPMFDIVSVDREEASNLLDESKISAYIVADDQPQLFVKSNGLNQTITKAFLDSWQRMRHTVQTILTTNPNAMAEGLIDDMMQQEEFVQMKTNGKNPNPILIYFYSLLAFTCIFACNYGLDEVINIQADQSLRGARINISPIHKMKLFLCNMLAAFTVHAVSIVLLFIYMYSVLKIQFGANLGYIVVLCVVGSLAGMFLGALVGTWGGKKASVKYATLSTITMVGAFLSGMMFAGMRTFIASNAPFINYINPVGLITDALFSLYYYDTYDRYFLTLIILGAMIILMGLTSYLGLRRKTYASL